MRRVRASDLTLTLDGPRVLVRSLPRGVGARVPPVAVALLALCEAPRTREEAIAALGPAAGPLFDGLVEAGLLVPPVEADATPHFFDGFGRVDTHRHMLADRARLDAYARAIAAAVRPGDVVVDAGTGTGVLAVLAARAGAARVYAIEHTDAARLAEEVVRSSGVADRITVIRGDFARVDLPEPVDLVITETFGALAWAEGAAADLAAGAARWLRPDGRILPGAVSLHLAPLGAAGAAAALDAFTGVDGVDLSPVAAMARTRGATLTVRAEHLLHPGAALPAAPFPAQGGTRGALHFDLTEGAEVHALAGWFTLALWEGHHLPTGPADPPTHWKQVVLPVPPIGVRGGLHLEVELGPDPADRRGLELIIDWRTEDGAGRWVHRVR